MASLQKWTSGVFYLAFRYQGKRFLRSLEITDEQEARRKKAQIEQTLKHLKDGVLYLADRTTPDQLWQFLRTGGRFTELPGVSDSVRLSTLCDRYLNSFAHGSKEQSTLDTEQHHLHHFQRVLGGAVSIENIGPGQLRDYVAMRQKEKGTHGSTVKPVTIGKELQTFRQLWDFARVDGCVAGDNPARQIKKPRGNQKQHFMVWEEIETRIERGGLSDGEIAELWETLFLREAEIGEFLRHAKTAARELPRFAYIYPVLAFCAYTGARRSEMFRCRVDDVKGNVLIREKKRSQDQQTTFRQMPLHPALDAVLQQWLAGHPGGQFLFCKSNQKPLDDKTSREAFDSVTRTSKWKVLRGFHVLRHSFASNLARHGVDQYKIDEFMGHQTEDMRKRYRHLFPEDRVSAINVLNFS